MRRLGVHTRFLDSGDDLQDPPAHRLPSPKTLSIEVGRDLSEGPLCVVEWSREGKPIATLALRVVVLGLLHPPADI